MGVRNHGRNSMKEEDFSEFSGCYRRGFNMDVTINESWRYITTICINDIFSAIFSYPCKISIYNGEITIDYFTVKDINYFSILNDGICRFFSRGHRDPSRYLTSLHLQHPLLSD